MSKLVKFYATWISPVKWVIHLYLNTFYNFMHVVWQPKIRSHLYNCDIMLKTLFIIYIIYIYLCKKTFSLYQDVDCLHGVFLRLYIVNSDFGGKRVPLCFFFFEKKTIVN